MKKILFLWIVGWGSLLCSFDVQGYFEHTYRCIIDDETIQVSLTTGDQRCLDYMAGVTKLLQQTTIDLQSATDNAGSTKGYDRAYREKIVQEVITKKATLTQVQQKIVLAMSDFEEELFVRVKGIVGYYLLVHTQEIEKKIIQGKNLLTRLIIVGNKEQYLFVRTQMDERERELMFLDRIKQSSDFAELLPPLKRWIALQETHN